MEKQTIALDSQWMTAIQTCPFLMKLRLLEHLRPEKKPEALERGDLIHQMFAAYYRGRKDKRSHGENLEAAIATANQAWPEMDLDYSVVEPVMKAATECLNFHQGDGWIPIMIEEPFSYELYEDDEVRIVSSGVIDLVADIPGLGITIIDHKSAKQNRAISILSDQFFNYSVAVNTPRVIVNQVGLQKTLPPEDKFRRPVMNYPTALLEEWKKDIVYWIKLGLWYQKNDYYPRNRSSCDKFMGCDYKPLCETIPDAREWKKTILYVKGEPWDPYTRDKVKEGASEPNQ